MNLASPFSLCLLAIVALSLLGLPIGHAMIGGSVLYLLLAGQIVSVEARHAAYIRDLIQNGTFSDTADANGLDQANSVATVLTAAQAFITEKLDGSSVGAR